MKIKALLIILVALIVIFGISKFYDNKKGESTMLTDLVDVDTSEITAIYFYPKEFDKKEIKLFKENNKWNLSYDDKVVAADENSINSILVQIDGLKPKRLVANSKDKWEKYEVTDSLGIVVKIESNGNLVSNLVIGKFDYNQNTRAGTSYVRLKDDKKVYLTDGFVSMAFNRSPDTYRNRSLINADSKDWTRISFNYPADSSFVLTKNNDSWIIDGVQVDSMATANYINSLSRLGGNGFVDEDLNTSISQPDYTITIEGNNLNPITLDAYNAAALNDIVIVSSQNKDSKFSGNAGKIFERIFVGKQKFVAAK